MGVICNGPRKSGTNALQAVVRELGYARLDGGVIDGRYYPTAWHRQRRQVESLDVLEDRLQGQFEIGAHWIECQTSHHLITILRDPREIAISQYRMNQRLKGAEATVDDFNAWYRANADQFVALTKPYFERSWPLQVWYPSLFEHDTVKAIAEYLGRSPLDVSNAWGQSSMWTGDPSCWREWLAADNKRAIEEAFNDVMPRGWKRWGKHSRHR